MELRDIPALTSHQPQFPGSNNCLCAIANIQFSVDMIDVRLDRADRNVQTVGDLTVRHALDDKNEYFLFSFTQRIRYRWSYGIK